MNGNTVATEFDSSIRGEMLAARLTPAQMEAVDGAAKTSGISRSEWVRRAVLAHLQLPQDELDASIESTILTEVLGLRYVVVNLLARANSNLNLQALYDVMAVADKEKRGAAVRALTSPNENPTP